MKVVAGGARSIPFAVAALLAFACCGADGDEGPADALAADVQPASDMDGSEVLDGAGPLDAVSDADSQAPDAGEVSSDVTTDVEMDTGGVLDAADDGGVQAEIDVPSDTGCSGTEFVPEPGGPVPTDATTNPDGGDAGADAGEEPCGIYGCAPALCKAGCEGGQCGCAPGQVCQGESCCTTDCYGKAWWEADGCGNRCGSKGMVARLSACDAADNDGFAAPISLSGDTLVAGSSLDDDDGHQSGSAYVFRRDSATGVWSHAQKLTPDDGSDSSRFGSGVSLEGNRIVIGGYGAAYVFEREAADGDFEQRAELVPEEVEPVSGFGHPVRLWGDTALVGASWSGEQGYSAGAAYVFVRDPETGSWSQEAKLLPDDPADHKRFGEALALHGDTAIVGAYGDDEQGHGAGAAYVFVRDPATGGWHQQAKLLDEAGEKGDSFGEGVGLWGDVAAIGADDTVIGYVSVFERDPETEEWTQTSRLGPWARALSAPGGVRFGWSVFLRENRMVVGAPFEKTEAGSTGAAYVLVRDPQDGTWTNHAKFAIQAGPENMGFGSSTSLQGGTLAIGAAGYDVGGAAFVFE